MNGRRLAFAALFLAGLVPRVVGLFFMGGEDMFRYFNWGTVANERGLAAAYVPTYFPFQWQIFQVCDAIASWWLENDSIGIPDHVRGSLGRHGPIVFAFKTPNLLAELGIFWLLIRLLRRWSLSPAYSLLFWCHPWFIAVGFLGYIDPQFAFFALLTAYLADRAEDLGGFALAGIPLSLAFLMKPQAQAIVLVVAISAVARWLWRREWHAFGLLAAPCALFSVYSYWFFLEGQSILDLAASYLGVTSAFPALTAQMLNVWYPLAYVLWPGGAIHLAPDTLSIAGPITIRAVAIAFTLATLLVYAVLLVKSARRGEFEDGWILLLAYSSLVFPMLMTSAHENHLYLATVFFAVLLPMAKRFHYRAAIHLLLLLQLVNVVGHYGLGINGLSRRVAFITEHWTPASGLFAAILACLCFAQTLDFLFELRTGDRGIPRRCLPGFGALAVAGVIQVSVLLTRVG